MSGLRGLLGMLKGNKPDYDYLNELENKEEIPGNYSYEGKAYTEARGDQMINNDMYKSRGIYNLDTPDGDRYYYGQNDRSFDRNTGFEMSRADAIRRAQMFPGDSLTTEQTQAFRKHGMFK
tara:strand:+ start:1044 stop:1406 length:363 start_codon:yes stop_codon:yes gene_type:complete